MHTYNIVSVPLRGSCSEMQSFTVRLSFSFIVSVPLRGSCSEIRSSEFSSKIF